MWSTHPGIMYCALCTDTCLIVIEITKSRIDSLISLIIVMFLQNKISGYMYSVSGLKFCPKVKV